MKQKILDILEQNRGKSISGAQIAKALNVTRSAVWKHINELKAEGFDIQSATNRGYCLNNSDDVFSKGAIVRYIDPQFDCDILIYDTLESTNTTARLLAQDGARPNTVVIAKQQTSGRGRFSRTFYSPDGCGLYLSIILDKKTDIKNAPLITCLAAVSVAGALRDLYCIDAGIKWVNDIFINGKKVCGILTEASISVESSTFDYIIVGIGINLNPPPQGYEHDIKDSAAAISEYTNQPILKNRLAGEVISRVLKYYKTLPERTFMQLYKQYSVVIGKSADIISSSGSQNVKILDITELGHLKVQNKNGEIEEISSGEISLRNIE